MTFSFFFFNDTATTEIYTLSLHDALPISPQPVHVLEADRAAAGDDHVRRRRPQRVQDRKSTRLNSSHLVISYAVFCLKKKPTKHNVSNRSGRGPTRSSTAAAAGD